MQDKGDKYDQIRSAAHVWECEIQIEKSKSGSTKYLNNFDCWINRVQMKSLPGP